MRCAPCGARQTPTRSGGGRAVSAEFGHVCRRVFLAAAVLAQCLPRFATKPMAADVPSLLAKLSENLKESGFDLLTPFLVSWYNDEEHIINLPAVHKLPADGDCLAVIVGNSRALWEPFLAWTRTQLEADPKWLESHPHALDAFTEEKMQQALAQPGMPASDVIYAAETLETTGRAISVTSAAHVSSLAFYHQTVSSLASNTPRLERRAPSTHPHTYPNPYPDPALRASCARPVDRVPRCRGLPRDPA